MNKIAFYLRVKRYSLIILICASILLSSQLAFAAQKPAPLYPGPVVSGGENVGIDYEHNDETLTYKIYYTRDSLKKVAAWYEGKMPAKYSDSASRISFKGVKGSSLEYNAVVVWRDDSGITESDILYPLEQEIVSGALDVVNTSHSQKDLDAVKAKYGYLATEAFFPKFSAKEKLDACEEEMKSDVASAQQDGMALQDKLAELASQGRFDEMEQYVSQAQNVNSDYIQAGSASHWDDWIECLDELEAAAFRSGISIRIK